MFVSLNQFYTNVGVKGITLNILVALTFTVLLFGAIVVLGRIIDFMETAVTQAIANKFGSKVANIICNYLTFPGVVLHELAHAIFIFVLGGKITQIKFFELGGNGRLGHVDYITQGGKIRQSLQLMFGSSAPTICGIFNLYLIYRVFESGTYPVWETALILYLGFSIAIHMSMSDADMKGYFKGVIYAAPVVFFLSYLVQYNLINT